MEGSSVQKFTLITEPDKAELNLECTLMISGSYCGWMRKNKISYHIRSAGRVRQEDYCGPPWENRSIRDLLKNRMRVFFFFFIIFAIKSTKSDSEY